MLQTRADTVRTKNEATRFVNSTRNNILKFNGPIEPGEESFALHLWSTSAPIGDLRHSYAPAAALIDFDWSLPVP